MKIPFDQKILDQAIQAAFKWAPALRDWDNNKIDKEFTKLVLELYKSLYEMPERIKQALHEE